jgi:UDP-3-O-[3-hydroxymyristoyl] glucosamine N-acyltransferase
VLRSTTIKKDLPSSVNIGDSSYIGSRCIINSGLIGSFVKIGDNVIIEPNCIIGDYVVIDSESYL